MRDRKTRIDVRIAATWALVVATAVAFWVLVFFAVRSWF